MAAIKLAAANAPGRTLAVDHLRKLGAEVGPLLAAHLLGGSAVLGPNLDRLLRYDPLQWDGIVSRGLPVKALYALLETFQGAQKPILEIIGINPRTLQRHRAAGVSRLDPDMGARAVSVAHLIERAIEVMGSPEAADQWLSTPNQALDGARPLELAKRPMGNQAALDVLNAVEHGMFG